MLLLAGGLVLAVGLLWVFTRLMAASPYQTLYSGLDPTDEQMLAQRLAAENVPFRVSANGASLSVPADQMDRVRMQMAAEGLPHSGQMGWEIFDKPNWMGSDFDDQVDYQRALEGELERTILTLSNVEAARVNLVLGHHSLFTRRARPAKASVVVRLDSGGLSPQQVAGIQHLVAGAVDNLSAKDVVVINAEDGLVLHSGPPAPYGPESNLQRELKDKLIALLTPVVGSGNVRTQVTVAYHRSTLDSDSVTYDPTGQVLVSSQVTRDSASLPGAVGIPGAASNVPGPQLDGPPAAIRAGKPGATGKGASTAKASGSRSAAAAGRGGKARRGAGPAGGGTPNGYAAIAAVGANQGENRSSEADQYVVSHEVTHQVTPAGRIKSISAAILVNEVPQTRMVKGHAVTTYQPRPASQMAQLRSLAMAAIGFSAQRGDQLTVQDIRFQLPPAAAPKAPNLGDRMHVFSANWAPELRYAGLLILFLLAYLLLFRPLQKVLVASLSREPALGAKPPAPALAQTAQTGLPGNASAAPAAGAAALPQLAEAPRPAAHLQRMDDLKQQLMATVKKEPEASARLVRHWIRSENAG